MPSFYNARDPSEGLLHYMLVKNSTNCTTSLVPKKKFGGTFQIYFFFFYKWYHRVFIVV